MTTKVVFGAPGTGKTTYILKDIMEKFNSPSGRDFTYVTFTKSAAEDFKRRVKKEFGLEDDEVKQMWVGTQHAVCLRLIGMRGRVVEENDRVNFCQVMGIAYKPFYVKTQEDDVFLTGGEIDDNLPIGNKAFAMDHRCRTRMTPPSNVEVDEVFVGEFGMKLLEGFMEEWKNYKTSLGKVDFDDMLEMVVEKKLCPPNLRGYFDEFQDYGALQYAVFEVWRNSMDEVVVAGDDDQCIFGYTGASPDFMLKEKGERVILGVNHRNCKEIYEKGLELIRKNTVRVEKNVVCANPKEGKVEKVNFYSDGIEGLRRYLVPGQRTFVLVRTNRQVKDICDVFDEQLIPYSCLRTGTPWTSNFLSLLSAFKKINLSKDTPLTPDELHELVSDLPQKDYIIRGKKQELMRKFDPISYNDLLKMYLKSETQDTLNIKNQSIPIELATLTEARVATIRSTRQKKIAKQYVGNLFPEIKTGFDIHIGTFHSSKGLEADKVILSDALPRKVLEGLGGMATEEERRVYYVAITRAREHLIFAYGLFDNTEPFMEEG